jgi:4-hydroxybenzoate polyprenyltransferase
LVRLPNAFTAPSNVIAGYFATTLLAETSGLQLASLMLSSGLLYIAGIVLNDYFDIELDRKERPSRPLPSGSVPKRHALVIAVAALAAANAIAFSAGSASLVISLAITGAILAYDYLLKHTIAGPSAMGSTRFLNVILGASPAIPSALFTGNMASLGIVVSAAASVFVYVVAITMLSKKEVGSQKPSPFVFSIVLATIASVAAIGLLLNLRLTFLLNLSVFAVIMVITFKRYIVADEPRVQKAIRNMVISIVVLDSVFVSGTAGMFYGLATLLLIAPAVVLAKKLYVT